jgi:peptide/nickel transport system substrate-binding protein
VAGKSWKWLVVIAVAVAIGLAAYFARQPATTGPASSALSSDRTSANATPVRGGELTASLRSEPATHNRYVDRSTAGEVLALLTQAPLVHVNRVTDTLEPWLAESWTESTDHLTFTLRLRQGVSFSDGTPLTSADVLFSYRALYDPRVQSPLASDTLVNGKPLQIEAPDPSTVIVRLPSLFAPGLRLVDGVPILPRHRLERALAEGTFNDAWSAKTPLTEIAGLGPFVLAEHTSGERLVLTRNPHYWRKDSAGTVLPYLDKLTVVFVSQVSDALKLQAGEIDLMASADIRPDDYSALKRAADQGRVRLIDGGFGPDPSLLWFNLTPVHAKEPANQLFHQKAFRQALSCVIDRQAIVNTVYLGAAVPIYGPVTPANRTWFADVHPACEYDVARARELFRAAGAIDRNGDGMLEDASGKPVRFSILTQAENIRARVVAVLQEQFRQAGIVVDIVPLDVGSLLKRFTEGNYDAIYFGIQSSATDPALSAGFWLSSGGWHFWNPEQKTPSTDWEGRIDDLMRQQAERFDLEERRRLFIEVQRIFADELPALYLVTPKVTIAVSTRVVNPQPAPQVPQLLWSADSLAAAPVHR